MVMRKATLGLLLGREEVVKLLVCHGGRGLG